MKNRLLFFALLYCLVSFGQQKIDITLNWTDNVPSSAGDINLKLPQFQQEYFSYNHSAQQIYFVSSFATPQQASGQSLQITNIVYEDITPAQLGNLSAQAVPSNINATLSPYKGREQWYASVSLSPIIKEGSAFKRVKSFSYTYALSNNNSGARSAQSANIISNSVLSSGNWYRFYVEKSGVYRLSRGFLQSLGLDVNTNPQNIKIYGNGGRMVPLLNATPYPMDLEENAIRFVGQEDGTFDNADYILFYAEGVDNWNTESLTNNNLFTNRAYYYVTAQGGAGKRIQPAVQPLGAPTAQTGVFDDYLFHEQDNVSIARLGRKWHGEQFNVENEQEFEFNVPDIAGEVTIEVSAAADAPSTTSMAIKANGAAVGNISFGANNDDATAARDGFFNGTFAPGSSDITITLTYSNNGNPASNAWLDYIRLTAKRNLRGNGRQFRFRLNSAAQDNGILQYNFTNATGIAEVWDVTDIYNTTSVTNGSGAQFSFKAPMGEVRQYVSVVSADFYTPLRESNARVANQNLKGTIFRNSQGQFQDVDYIIVTPEFLNSSAETLANLHRTQSGLNVKVVNLENIYHEFSSGQQDIGGIRNFVKYVYNNASSAGARIKYLNLFGDASFDYKDRIPNNTNIVPTFHGFDPSGGSAIPNYSEVNTFVSDDFFGLMDPSEGTMIGDEGLDIAVGRMLVSSKAQADEMVNKVIEYRNEESYGRWRNEYVMIADDLDNSGEQFVNTLEQIGSDILGARPFINIRKIYIDAFIQQASAGGYRYPEAKEEIARYINNGSLVVNYLGHGGETGMASERIFQSADAQDLTNRYRYPLFITATCELTKFDNPYLQTAGEFIYWNSRGGAIAMITTTRSIYINTAFTFNSMLSAKLYDYGTAPLGGYPSMAEALRLTKLQLESVYVRCVSFIGDPALKLAIPQPEVELTTVNGVPVAEATTELQSLAYVTMGGRVTNGNGSTLSNYSGQIEVSVFDKPIARVTLVNDNVDSDPKNFNTLGETIFRGNVSVTNGVFTFGFVVPRDIRIPVGEGRVSFYSKRNNVLEDHTGHNNTIRIGGINPNAAEDNIAPTARLYMNEETFVSGGITNESPILLAILADANGINTASGIGHDIIGILDGDETSPYLMNDYYEAALDDHTRGTVRFPFVNLEPGLHTLSFQAWDVYNNLVTAEIQFVVTGDDELKLERVLNYPNPFVSYTEFWFSHNRPFEPLDVQVQIFTVTGKIVKTINQSVTTDGFLCRDIKWDGLDDFGSKIGKGVYVYKLTVRSSTTNKRAEKYEKLVLL